MLSLEREEFVRDDKPRFVQEVYRRLRGPAVIVRRCLHGVVICAAVAAGVGTRDPLRMKLWPKTATSCTEPKHP